MPNTQTNKINPFYIEPAQKEEEDDEWGWGDDTDDLEELLGDGDEEQRHPTAQQYQSVGGLPVRNLAYESDSRVKYVLGALIAVILLISVVSTGGGSGPPAHTSKDQHDSIIDETQKQPRIIVIGERNSGIPWVEHSLNICFPNATVSHTLQRGGYFFQDEIDVSDQEIHVVVVALNPYDWVHLMRTHPQYMPNHANIEDWKHFVEMEWTMDRPERDFDVKGQPGKVCQLDFEVNQVISCLPATEGDPNDNPIYELKQDGSGEPFSSILQLRAEKFRNHVHQVSQWVDSLTIVKYEDLVADTTDSALNAVPGIFDVMQSIASQSDLSWSCSFRNAPVAGAEEALPADFVAYMNENVDWDAEALFGYNPLPSKPGDDGFTDDDDDTTIATDDDHLPEGVTYPPTTSPTESAAEADTAVPTATPTEAKAEEQTPSPTKEATVATESPTSKEGDELSPTLAPTHSTDDGSQSNSVPTGDSGKDGDSATDDNDDDDDSFDDDTIGDDDDEKSAVDDDDDVDGGDDGEKSAVDDNKVDGGDDDGDDDEETDDDDVDGGDDGEKNAVDDDDDVDDVDDGDDDGDDDEDTVVDDDDDVDGNDDAKGADDSDSTISPTAAVSETTPEPTMVKTVSPTAAVAEITPEPTMLKTSPPTSAPTAAKTSAPTKAAKTASPTAAATKESKDGDAKKESASDGKDKAAKKDEKKDTKKDTHATDKKDADKGKDDKKKDDKSDKKSSTKKKDDDKDKTKKDGDDADEGEKKKKKHHHKKDGEKDGEKHKHKNSDETKGKDDKKKKDKSKKHTSGGTDSDEKKPTKSGGNR